VTVLAPADSDKDPLACPDVTVEYDPDPTFTWIVEVPIEEVGVTVIPVVAFVTFAVYENVPEAKVGDRVPDEIVNPDRVAPYGVTELEAEEELPDPARFVATTVKV
jgi:hypothetical protein